MQKMKSLRKALTDSVPQLKANREMMRIFADEGNIDARLAASLSHEKIYTLNVIVCDFVGDPDLSFVSVAAGLRENQPDIGISISVQLTERTIVRNENGALHISYAPELPLHEPVMQPTKLYINGELVSW
ncbi:phage tail protein [Pseudescherichia sp.]|uniref:phage tail protein n=1 Tax=Pseudescherichia sp. TaxID=2055881 RepID=UPI003917D485